jgi:hypothetical protein
MQRFGLQPPLAALDDWVTVGGREEVTPSDWVYLGKLAEYGHQWRVRFAVGDEKVVAIFGKRGQGKSFTLGALIEALAVKNAEPDIGCVTSDRSVLLVDPLNIFQWIDVPLTEDAAAHSEELASQVKRARQWGLHGVPIAATIYYPAGYGDSAFRTGAQEFRLGVGDFQLDEWSVLLDFDIVRDIRGQLVAEVFAKVTSEGWRGPQGNIAAKQHPTIDDFRDCLRDDADINSGIYTTETIRAVTQRLRAIARYDVFCGVATPLNRLLTPGRISVLLVNALPEDLRHVVVSVLARRIVGARAAASGAQKDLLLSPGLTVDERRIRQEAIAAAPPRTWLVVDEAQDVVPAGRKTSATESIVKLVKEGRNFGLSFVLTTQQPRAIDARVLSQVETFFVHKLVSRADVDVVLDSLKCPLPSEIRFQDDLIDMHELIGLLDIGQMMVSDTYARRCTVVTVRARVGAHGGFEA